MNAGLGRTRPWHAGLSAVVVLTVLPACLAAAGPAARPAKPDPNQGGATMKIESTAFAHGQTIPKKHTGEGADVSPPLTWSNLPAGVRELALICDDPDAPRPQPWVHWVIYKIPAVCTGLPEGVPRDKQLADPAGALQGLNSWPSIGYRGPMPPPGHGVHHYHFRLYALDKPLDLKAGLDKAGLLTALKGHVLAEAVLTGAYQR